MANNDDENPRRNPPRPEDNPFIAFRRFTDSQVSSLFNSVVSLPATIASYNNVHRAREHCLFGKADERQCDRLREVEAEIAQRRHEGRDSFGAGDVHAVIKTGEALLKLNREADDIRQQIVQTSAEADGENQLVQRVANEKGQEWGWSHSWGWPAPFDEQRRTSEADQEHGPGRQIDQRDLLLMLQSEARELMGERAYDETMSTLVKIFQGGEVREENNGEARNAGSNQVERYCPREDSSQERQKPRVWTWSKSWQWPPPADSPQPDDSAYSPHKLERDQDLQRAGINWREAYDDLTRSEHPEAREPSEGDTATHRRRFMWRSGCTRHQPRGLDTGSQTKADTRERAETHDEPSYEYSHDHEDQHDEPPSPKVKQDTHSRGFTAGREDDNSRVAKQDFEYEQALSRHRNNRQQFWHMLGQSQSSEKESTAAHESHDQQSEQVPLPTELDAYEQLLGTKSDPLSSSTSTTPTPALAAAFAPAQTQASEAASSSILSTLTTTERTVGPDGSITTKVMLKKRFADGREESSETVHTQRGHDDLVGARDPWKALRARQEEGSVKESRVGERAKVDEGAKEAKKGRKSGWFWSS